MSTLRHARPLVAGLDLVSVAAITDALLAGDTIGLIHDRLPDAERAALTARLAATPVPGDTAVVVFTSGSTGRPKGVAISYAAIDAAVELAHGVLGRRVDDRWLLALPPAHVGGLGVLARCLGADLTCSLAGGGDRDALARAFATENPTLCSLVPTQLAALLEDPGWRPPPRLRAILLGGAAAGSDLVARARGRGVPVLTTYGMSETFGQVATAPLGELPPPGAIGRPLAGVTIEAGTRAEPATIIIHTPAAFTCYLDELRVHPDAVVTSDLGFVEDGWLHVVGRADDVIITGGEKVHPLAVEDALASVPGLVGLCVVGLPDAHWGQRVAAAVVAGPGFDRAALDAAIAALAPHARPREVVMIDALPLGPTGKPDRAAVRARLLSASSW